MTCQLYREIVEAQRIPVPFEFRNRADQQPADVGTVKVNATMPMAGMPPRIGNTTVARLDTGRYGIDADLDMAGAWRIGVEWAGPAGSGTATLPGKVQ